MSDDNAMLQLLPQVFRDDQGTRDFLKAFERMLLRTADDTTAALGANVRGLEAVVDDMARHFKPGTNASDGAPDEFLPWLSQWVALTLRTDITLDQARDNAIRRKFIARAALYYARRGTKRNLTELLAIFTSRDVSIRDQIDGKPHYFEVSLNLDAIKTSDTQQAYARASELAHSVIRLEKPAHTRYLLIPAVTTFRIGQREIPPPASVAVPTPYFIRVGINTRLGAIPRR